MWRRPLMRGLVVAVRYAGRGDAALVIARRRDAVPSRLSRGGSPCPSRRRGGGAGEGKGEGGEKTHARFPTNELQKRALVLLSVGRAVLMPAGGAPCRPSWSATNNAADEKSVRDNWSHARSRRPADQIGSVQWPWWWYQITRVACAGDPAGRGRGRRDATETKMEAETDTAAIVISFDTVWTRQANVGDIVVVIATTCNNWDNPAFFDPASLPLQPGQRRASARRRLADAPWASTPRSGRAAALFVAPKVMVVSATGARRLRAATASPRPAAAADLRRRRDHDTHRAGRPALLCHRHRRLRHHRSRCAIGTTSPTSTPTARCNIRLCAARKAHRAS